MLIVAINCTVFCTRLHFSSVDYWDPYAELNLMKHHGIFFFNVLVCNFCLPTCDVQMLVSSCVLQFTVLKLPLFVLCSSRRLESTFNSCRIKAVCLSKFYSRHVELGRQFQSCFKFSVACWFAPRFKNFSCSPLCFCSPIELSNNFLFFFCIHFILFFNRIIVSLAVYLCHRWAGFSIKISFYKQCYISPCLFHDFLENLETPCGIEFDCRNCHQYPISCACNVRVKVWNFGWCQFAYFKILKYW